MHIESFYSMYEFTGFDGREWHAYFLSGNGRLFNETETGRENRRAFFFACTEAYLAQRAEQPFKGRTVEGKIYDKKRYQMLGCLGGYRYDAVIETDFGTVTLEVLVDQPAERIAAPMN